MENNNNNNLNSIEDDDDDTNSILSEFSIDEEIMKIPILKRILTSCICNFAYFLHFLPSLIYNSICIIIFNTIVPNNKEKENLINFNNCIDLFKWEKNIINISKLMFTKELIFMFISLFFGKNENDFNFILMIIKYLFNFVCSIPFEISLYKFLNNYGMDYEQNFIIENNNNNKEEYCQVLLSKIKIFNYIEITMIKIFCLIIVFIFIVISLLMIYEYWKGRRYIIR